MSHTQQPISVDHDASAEHKSHSGEVEWYRRGCASFDKRSGGLQKTRLGGMRAVMVTADRLWDAGQVKLPFVYFQTAKLTGI